MKRCKPTRLETDMKQETKKIGALRLSGLMIGPILGSGIFLLPPIAYEKMGNHSIWAWLLVMGLGGLFAFIFAKLTIEYPGDGGMTIAIEKVLGRPFKIYASLLMITAVSFGPAAVMLTAAKYLKGTGQIGEMGITSIAIGLVVLSFLLLGKELKVISTLSLVASILIGVILTLSSLMTIVKGGVHIGGLQTLPLGQLGGTAMLLFWAIIGWEIVGNYALAVKSLKKTLPLATGISLAAVTLIYLVVALAVQSADFSTGRGLAVLLDPLFGVRSEWVLAILITALCLSTYLLIVGALARLVLDLAREGVLPKVFNHVNKNTVPMRAVSYFTFAHILVLFLSQLGIIDLEIIVGIANGFFLANALIGLIASYSILKDLPFKIGAVVLSIGLIILLLYSNPLIWVVLLIEGLATLFISRHNEIIR